MKENNGHIKQTLRQCSLCKEHKSLDDFYTYTTGKPHGQCKVCIREKQQKQRKDNPVLYNKSNQERHTRNKLRAIEYKGSKCFDCGQKYDPCVYDFHHLNPEEKDSSWSLHRSWNYLKQELDKCILLCANCHRIRHWKQENI